MKITVPLGSRFARALFGLLGIAGFASPDGPGVLTSIQVKSDFQLSTDPDSKNWKNVQGVIADHDPFGKPLPEAHTEIRSRWTKKNLYFMFIANYRDLYLKANPLLDKETWGLWDFDVDEVFIGQDRQNINLYKEFEVSPQGEYIDLDVDHSRKDGVNWLWNSGMRLKTRIDREHKISYCEIQIPWKGVAAHKPKNGDQFRLNLYRIEGGPAPRKYIVWQITNSPSFHTPQAFGRLVLGKQE